MSHASTDKPDFVTPLVQELKKTSDLTLWYDEDNMPPGESIRRSISEGLKTCDYGLVILSPAYMQSKWAQNELNALFSLEELDENRIIPVWHNVSANDVREFCPMLADRVAIDRNGVIGVAKDVLKSVGFLEQGRRMRPLDNAIRTLQIDQKRKADALHSEQALFGESGVALVDSAAQQCINKLRTTCDVLVTDPDNQDFSIDTPELGNGRYSTNVWCGEFCLRFAYARQYANSARQSILDCVILKGHWNRFGIESYSGSTIIHRTRYRPFIAKDNIVRWLDAQERPIPCDSLCEEWIGLFAETI